MPVLRNKLSSTRAGGPRQFAELRNKVIASAEDFDSLSDARSELDRLGMDTDILNNAPIITAEPRDRIETVIERLESRGVDDVKMRQAVSDIEDARKAGEEVIDTTIATLRATDQILNRMRSMTGVMMADFVTTRADFGPENLRFTPDELADVPLDSAAEQRGTQQELLDRLGVTDAWDTTRGENAIVAIFDTGYAEDLIDSSRIVGTFNGGGTNSPWAAPEGHGTMTAGAAAANSSEGVPFDGVAPDAGVALLRITDDQGQIRGDLITKAWDWLISKNFDRPVVANHSYGTPICSGRPKANFCTGPDVEMVKLANSDSDITSVYAAGNEAMTCGHRPSGLTNAITGTNSIAEVITVGALRFDGREAQRYSSHGRGDCAPVADPKPNVSSAIANKMYYGAEGGYKVKDMSMGVGGSSGGTSYASPATAGLVALMQSAAFEANGEGLQTEEVKAILHDVAEPPRPTQINSFGMVLGEEGYDARFGRGQWDPANAVQEAVR